MSSGVRASDPPAQASFAGSRQRRNTSAIERKADSFPAVSIPSKDPDRTRGDPAVSIQNDSGSPQGPGDHGVTGSCSQPIASRRKTS
jgi:hypothetical protein